MKKKIIKTGIIALIIIIGIVIMAFTHFKFDLYYSKNTRVEIYLGKQFSVQEVKSKLEEVMPEKKTIVEVAGAFNDTISITTDEITDDELNQIVTKLNETYQTELSVETDTEVIKNGNIRGRDLYSPYLVVSAIVAILEVVSLVVLYRKKVNVAKIVLISIGMIALGQFLYFIVLSITGLEINRIMPASSVAIYVFSMIYLASQFEKAKEIETK